MNRDDIIRLAQEAGGRIEHIGTNIAWFEFLPKNLEHFAALVAAAEREACAKVCDELHDKIELVEKTEHYLGEYGSEYDAGQGNAISECVDAIRARNNK